MLQSIHRRNHLERCGLLPTYATVMCICYLLHTENSSVKGFQPSAYHSTVQRDRQQHSQISALINPGDVPSQQITQASVQSHQASIMRTVDYDIRQTHNLLASSTTTNTKSFDMMKWRREHNEFKPPPYVQPNKSIPPGGHIVGNTVPVDASDAIQEKALAAIKNGRTVLDASKMDTFDDILPGFRPTKSILAPHQFKTEDTTNKFVARTKYSDVLVSIFDKVPFVAFWYVVIEFFFLRNNLDIYKEEVEDDPTGVSTEAISDLGVRVGIFVVLALLTLIIS